MTGFVPIEERVHSLRVHEGKCDLRQCWKIALILKSKVYIVVFSSLVTLRGDMPLDVSRNS